MAKSSAAKCRDYRARQPRKLALPMPAGTERALAELMEWHGFDDEREAITTFIHRLHEMGEDGSRKAFEVLRHHYQPPEEVAQRLYAEGARSREEA